MDLVRKILIDFEASGEFQTSDPTEAGHVAIMLDAGLVVAATGLDGKGKIRNAAILRLTWSGHDFIDNARKPEIWEKIKESFKDRIISASFDVIMALLVETMKTTLRIPL